MKENPTSLKDTKKMMAFFSKLSSYLDIKKTIIAKYCKVNLHNFQKLCIPHHFSGVNLCIYYNHVPSTFLTIFPKLESLPSDYCLQMSRTGLSFGNAKKTQRKQTKKSLICSKQSPQSKLSLKDA